MAFQQTSISTTGIAEDPRTAPGTSSLNEQQANNEVGSRLRGRWLLLARLIWLATMALAVTFLAVALPVRFDKLLNFQRVYLLDPSSANGALDPAEVQNALQQLGISAEFYAAYNTAIELIMLLGFLGVGAIIFSRKSNDWMAIAVSFTLVTFGPALTFASFSLVDAQPEWRIVYTILNLGWTTFGLVFFGLFPDGKFVPRWMRIWAVAWLAFTLCWPIIPTESPYHPERWPIALTALLLGTLLSVGVYAQVYRYRKLSNPALREQTKWVVFGMTIAFVGLVGSALLYVILQESGQPDSTQLLYDLLVVAPIYYIGALCLSLSVGVSVLRYRLYNIDLIINRTLVYVPLTAILAGLYSASIALFQKLFMAATGEKSDAAVVITTLLLATTFTPIKNLLQTTVDKRFKEAPDATRKLKAFDQQVKSIEEVIDPRRIVTRLLEEASEAFNATSGAVYLKQNSGLQLVHTSDNWQGDPKLTIALESDDKQIGSLQLGARDDGRDYSLEDQEMLRQVADRVARVVHLAERTG